jgi:hypothetical protein
MAEKPTQDEINKWQRYFAIECNNRALYLASKSERTADEDGEMLNAAYAAAFHWAKVGKPVNDARADMALAHILSLLGHGRRALHHAQRCLAFFEQNGGEDWDLAFAQAETAFAAAVAGNKMLHARHYALARERAAAIKSEEDRKVFDEEFARIPSAVLPKYGG